MCINARVSEGELCLEVVDDGPGAQAGAQNKGTGLGLTNTENRLCELYGDNQSFEVSSASPGGFKVRICIPYEVNRTDDNDIILANVSS